jgi:hypothetical protein
MKGNPEGEGHCMWHGAFAPSPPKGERVGVRGRFHRGRLAEGCGLAEG